MIVGRDKHSHSACFDELNDAIEALIPTVWKKTPSGQIALPKYKVALNAHSFPDDIPDGVVVYNLENVGIQLEPTSFIGREVWDFSKRNMDIWKLFRHVTYVPVGYHHTMERFAHAEKYHYDVIFCGAQNERRDHILDALMARGLRVCRVPPEMYGKERDALLARSRLAINMRFYEDGIHPVLRTAHCTANRLPVLCESSPEVPDWALLQCPYEDLVDRAYGLVTRRREFLDHIAEAAYLAFRMCPMVLP